MINSYNVKYTKNMYGGNFGNPIDSTKSISDFVSNDSDNGVIDRSSIDRSSIDRQTECSTHIYSPDNISDNPNISNDSNISDNPNTGKTDIPIIKKRNISNKKIFRTKVKIGSMFINSNRKGIRYFGSKTCKNK